MERTEQLENDKVRLLTLLARAMPQLLNHQLFHGPLLTKVDQDQLAKLLSDVRWELVKNDPDIIADGILQEKALMKYYPQTDLKEPMVIDGNNQRVWRIWKQRHILYPYLDEKTTYPEFNDFLITKGEMEQYKAMTNVEFRKIVEPLENATK